MPADLPFLLLPGMAADVRLFESQLAVFPTLRVPSWIDPLPGESLRSYAARFAKLIDPGVPCVVGGASFGGIVAREVTPHLYALGCVLIGSIRSPAELSWRWRALRPLALLGPDSLGLTAGWAARLPPLGRRTARRLERLAAPRSAFMRWATCAVLRWQPNPASRRVPVYQIHGELDATLPAANSHADVIVPGGTHALTVFQPSAVNEYLRRTLDQLRGEPGA
jgi:pimeloyl-ACP methyl ester carboxylesterase